MADYAKLTLFLEEIGELKRVKRSGWWHCGVRDPESVAEHSFRTAIIAYILACERGEENPEKIAFQALVHDVSESRLLDKHRASQHYLPKNRETEKKIIEDQAALLPDKTRTRFLELFAEKNPLVKEADVLEFLLQAKEYEDAGFKHAKTLYKLSKDRLHTREGKDLAKTFRQAREQWWKKF